MVAELMQLAARRDRCSPLSEQFDRLAEVCRIDISELVAGTDADVPHLEAARVRGQFGTTST